MRVRAHRDDARLVLMMVAVRRARAGFLEIRDKPATPALRRELADRVRALVEAMESYADTAAASGVPLPYRYRDDLYLYRAMDKAQPE